MRRFFSRMLGVALVAAALWLILFGKRPTEFRLPAWGADGRVITGAGEPVRGRVIVTFWEKWTRHESAAMQDVVDRFNLSQNKIFVNMVSMSQIDQKIQVATAGGDPPDIAGLWAAQIAPYMADGAIEPLDDLMADGTISETTYKPFVWNTCAPVCADGKRRLYAVSSTPVVCALFWNKDMFRAAGLDPEKGPQTIEELTEMADKLTIMEGSKVKQAGFLPNEPGWWDYAWGMYWGNKLYDAQAEHFNIDTPGQHAAYEWYQGFAKRYPDIQQLQAFQSGFGQFNSPQNAFINGRVAIVLQGPFFAKFIELNNSALVGHYAVAPMPLPKSMGLPPGTIALGDLDTWVIPRGARHRQEALEVLRFFTKRENMERLCLGHYKPSPLTDVSPEFASRNGNPYIGVFEKVMFSKQVLTMPDSPVWERVRVEIIRCTRNMWREPDKHPVDETLRQLQKTADGYVGEYNHYRDMRRAREGKTERGGGGAGR